MTFYINFGKKIEFTTPYAFLEEGQFHGPPGFATGYSCSILIIEYFLSGGSYVEFV